MKTLLRLRWLWLVALAGGLGLMTPRASAGVFIHIGVGEPAPRPVVYHYDYYPEAEVYFVPETHLYWWNRDGVWVSGPRVPEGIVLGSSVQLDVDDHDPWRHHEIILKRYPRHERREARHERREERREERHEEHDRD